MSSAWATGSCLCGTVKYALSKEPEEIQRYFCHCVLCKKASGSAFMANWWILDNGVFQITSGSDQLGSFVVTDTISKAHVTRSFCKSCGSPISLKTTNPKAADRIGFTAGTLDFDKKLPVEQNQALHWTPGFEVFAEDRLTGLSAVQGATQI